MALTRSKIIAYGVATSVALFLVSQNACVRAEWARHRLKPGMTIGDVLQVSGEWTWGSVSSRAPDAEPGASLSLSHSGDYFIHVRGIDGNQRVGSREELAGILENQGSGKPWRLAFTYSGIPRVHFAVFFDASNRVERISEATGAD